VLDGAATMSVVTPTDKTAQNVLAPANDVNSWMPLFVDATTSVSADDESLKVTVGKIGDKAWQDSIIQRDVPMTEGQSYILKFRAKASEVRTIFTMMQIQGGDWHSVGIAEITPLANEWHTYAYTFTAKGLAADGVQLVFQLGQSSGNVWLADLSLSPASGNVAVPAPASAVQVNITQAANPSWKIMLMSADQNLVEGHKYTLSYAVKSDKPRSMGAIAQFDGGDYHAIGKADFRVYATPVWHHHSVAFTATNVKPNGTLFVFPIGQTTGNVWVGDVTLAETP
jgi:hypothetical protein